MKFAEMQLVWDLIEMKKFSSQFEKTAEKNIGVQ
jgi:hypothetical protein